MNGERFFGVIVIDAREKALIAFLCNRIVPYAVEFVKSQGRMKYVRPLYRALRSSNVGAQAAVDTFEQNKQMYVTTLLILLLKS